MKLSQALVTKLPIRRLAALVIGPLFAWIAWVSFHDLSNHYRDYVNAQDAARRLVVLEAAREVVNKAEIEYIAGFAYVVTRLPEAGAILAAQQSGTDTAVAEAELLEFGPEYEELGVLDEFGNIVEFARTIPAIREQARREDFQALEVEADFAAFFDEYRKLQSRLFVGPSGDLHAEFERVREVSQAIREYKNLIIQEINILASVDRTEVNASALIRYGTYIESIIAPLEDDALYADIVAEFLEVDTAFSEAFRRGTVDGGEVDTGSVVQVLSLGLEQLGRLISIQDIALGELASSAEALSGARLRTIYVQFGMVVVGFAMFAVLVGLIVNGFLSVFARTARAAKEGVHDGRFGYPARGKNEISIMIDALEEAQAEVAAQKAKTQRILEQRSRELSDTNELYERTQTRSVHISDQMVKLTEQTNTILETVKKVQNSLHAAAEDSAHIRDTTSKGGNVVDAANVRMKEIAASTLDMGRFVKDIEEIAFQTHLVAINARIEAARAGSAGKGFTVVAGEVQQLAARATKAAGEIDELIQLALGQVENSVKVVEDSAHALRSSSDDAQKIAQRISELNDLCAVEMRNMNQLFTAIHDVESAAGQIADETAANIAAQ